MKLTRRRFSAAAGAAVMTAGLRRSAASAGVPALFFDVFGTLVDWRSSIARQAQASLEPLGHKIDWLRFADAWAGEYQPSLEEVRSGRRPFVKLDVLNLESLVRTASASKASRERPCRSSTSLGTSSMPGRTCPAV
jgi:hypothetical protein